MKRWTLDRLEYPTRFMCACQVRALPQYISSAHRSVLWGTLLGGTAASMTIETLQR